MKNKQIFKPLALAITLSLGLSSCSDDDKATTGNAAVKQVQTASSSDMMSYIPADTPILALYVQDENNPLPETLKEKMGNVYDGLGDLIRLAVTEEINKQSDETKKQEAQEFMDKWLSDEGIEKIGLSMDENEMALYAINLSPVLRMTLAKSHKMDEVLDEILESVNKEKPGAAVKKDMQGQSVYLLGDKEVQIIVSLEGTTLVASLAPTHKTDEMLPQLLGLEKPSQNLRDSDTYKSTLKKYNYLSNNLYWFDLRQIADYFINPGSYNSPMLDMMEIQDNKFSDVCKSEILAMFDKAPRLVGGTTGMQEHEMNSHLVWEMDSTLGTKLSTITGRIPKSSDSAKLAYGFSFDIAAAKKVAQDFANDIQQSPFECELFAGMNSQVAMIQQQLNQPLPPFVSNFKGFNMVLDELDLDFTQTDPNQMVKSVKGNILLAVDNPEALKGMAEMMMPELQKLGLVAGGDAVNISSLIPVKGAMIPVNLDHVFLAMGDETIGVSLGENTDSSLKTSVSNDSDKALLSFKIEAGLYKNLFGGISELAQNLPEAQQKQMELQRTMMNDMLWWEKEEATINFTENGLEIFADVIY